MCLQDLQLGRGRQVGKTVLVNDDGTSSILLQPDARRVAIIISTVNQTAAAVGIFNSPSAQFPLFYFNDAGYRLPIILRIEDLGQLVTDSLYLGQSGTGTDVIVTPIFTNEVSPPIP